MLTYSRPKGSKDYKELIAYKGGKEFAKIWTYKHTKAWFGKINGGNLTLKFEKSSRKLNNLNEAFAAIIALAEIK